LRLREDLDGLRVRHPREGRVDHGLELRDEPRAVARLLERELVGARVQQRADYTLDRGLAHGACGCEVRKSNFGLQHPELGQVARCQRGLYVTSKRAGNVMM